MRFPARIDSKLEKTRLELGSNSNSNRQTDKETSSNRIRIART